MEEGAAELATQFHEQSHDLHIQKSWHCLNRSMVINGRVMSNISHDCSGNKADHMLLVLHA